MAAPEHASPGRLAPAAFLATAIQLALLVHAIRVFRLEEALGLVAIAPVVLGGFCLHAWLPARWKAPGFLLLSLVAFGAVLGVRDASIVVAISAVLFAVCHLPVAVALRGLLLVALGAGLAALRTGAVPTSWAASVVPVVAAMFMFRSIVYLYDLRHEREAAPWCTRLSYFFLLPNVCFLLFPVVDYRTFRRTWYDRPAAELHRRGIHWALRGVVHLLLYRAVYAYLTPVAADVQDLSGVVRYVVSSYLLYLRISGHFHLIAGLLHLFGYGLPETNRNYLFASSFTDTWRRINVYWTEFMKKIVYFPVFMRLRRAGTTQAMVAATALTFLVTWLLHVYQWFWLQGDLLLASDGLFWGLAGVLAVGSTLVEAREQGRSVLETRAPSWGTALVRSVRTVGVVTTICVIWSLWCSHSVEEWVGVLSAARDAPRYEVLALGAGVLAILAAGTVGQRWAPAFEARASASSSPLRLAPALGVLAVALAGHRPVQALAGESAVAAMAPITDGLLNERDRGVLVASYYDRLVDRFGGRSGAGAGRERQPEPFRESEVSEEVAGPLQWELPPSIDETFEGARVTTNRWGMRDREYSLAKPDGTFRIAILGTCYEMGTGVANSEVWEAVAEELLVRELSPRTGLAYESLNFSVAGYDLLQLVTVVREKVSAFEPDLVVVSNHVRSSVDFVLRRDTDTSRWPSGLEEFIAVKREEQGVRWEAELEGWALREIATVCESLGARPALLSVPLLEEPPGLSPNELELWVEEQMDRARRAGYAILDTRGAFEGEARGSLALPHLERAPNARGHALLAREFCRALLRQPEGLGAAPLLDSGD